MSQIKELDFQIAFGAVKHFGRNLYTTNPPAIAELIANAYDAYAKSCKIYLRDKELIIVDDGIGMTDEEFQNRYAKSGYDKDYNIRKPNEMKLRPYMGRKGIGKFSAFSLANKFHLFTKSSSDDEWKKITLDHNILDTKEATVKIPISRYKSIESIGKLFNIELPKETGTIIYLPNLTRRITGSTKNALSNLISRRFSVTALITDNDFNVSIDDKPISLIDHFYYEFLEYIYYFGITKTLIKSRFKNIPEENFIHVSNDFFTDNNIRGWVASVDKPAKLRTVDGTRLQGISVYINGKISDENILRFSRADQIPNSYIIGEVDANFLQTLEQDPVLSSREGLNLELPEVIALRDNIKDVRDTLLEKWNEMRANRDISKQDYIKVALEKPAYNEMYEKLNDKEQKKVLKYAQRLFDKPSKTSDEIVDMYLPAVMQIVNDEVLNQISIKTGLESSEILILFSKLFDIAEVNHAIRMRANVLNRVSMIKELQHYIDNGEVEKVFENHLARNPWLIEPFWDAKDIRVSQQNKYTYLGIDNKETNMYTDLIIEVAEELLPIVVEIKREKKSNYSTPDVEHIIKQVSKYREGIITHYEKQFPHSVHDVFAVKAYFIAGKASMDKLSKFNLQSLERLDIKYRTYDELLSMSRKIYVDTFDIEE